MPAINTMQCCGIKEISGLSEREFRNQPTKTLKYLLTVFGRDLAVYNTIFACGALLFTEAGDIVSANYATSFAEFIVKSKLGKIRTVPEFYNPNSGRMVRTFIWAIDFKALTAWRDAHRD